MKYRLNLTQRIGIYFAIACGIFIAFDAMLSWNSYVDHMRQMQLAADGAEGIATQQTSDMLQVSDIVLQTLRAQINTQSTTPLSLLEIKGLMTRSIASAPELLGATMIDAQGNLLATTYTAALHSVNSADRDFFIYHRTYADFAMRINPPIQSRVMGGWILPLTMRLEHADGSFAGIVVVDLNLAFLTRFYTSMNLGRHGSVNLFRDDGVLLMHWPYQLRYFKRGLENSRIFRDFATLGASGSLTRTSPSDGVKRFYSIRHLENYPVYIAVGIGTWDMLANWPIRAAEHAAACLLIVLFISLSYKHLIQQILLRNQTEKKLSEANEVLRKMAMQDGLTSIANRRCFDLTLSEEFRRARRHGYSLALIMLDIDYFKEYNDCYGHIAGDECLKRIAVAIQTAAARRPGDLVARYGGEEFVILLPETDMDNAMAIGEKILTAVRELEIPHANSLDGCVTVSVGVNAYPPVEDFDEYGTLLTTADNALYRAKKNGRNQVCSPAAESPVLQQS